MKRFLMASAAVWMFATGALGAEPSATTGPISEGIVQQPAIGLEPMIGTCCIGGDYQGVRQDTECTEVKTPSRDKFTMEIRQAPRCGGTFAATVTDAKDGHVSFFTGTVSESAQKGCCSISAKARSTTDTTTFNGVLCKGPTRTWEGKGQYVSDCRGVWEMRQR
jgi:hypothetical protein